MSKVGESPLVDLELGQMPGTAEEELLGEGDWVWGEMEDWQLTVDELGGATVSSELLAWGVTLGVDNGSDSSDCEGGLPELDKEVGRIVDLAGGL